MIAGLWTYGFASIAVGLASATEGVDFSKTINLGAVIIGLLIVAVAGLFTIRSNVAKIWRENAEGEKAAREAAEHEAKEQRELKHALKTDLATEKLQRAAEVAKMKLEHETEFSALKLNYENELAAQKLKTDLEPLAALVERLSVEGHDAILAALDASTTRIIEQIKERL